MTTFVSEKLLHQAVKFSLNLFLFFLFGMISRTVFAQPTIKLGVLVFGTVNWELAALKNEHLLDGAEFKLDIVPLANPQTTKIALQSSSVDMIVSDWIWVSRMRGNGTDFTFYPYSTTAGALMVGSSSPIKTIADLPGKRLGIAGGELDKNWLLLQALALKQHIDLSTTEKVFAAPPLLNEQLKAQRVDAVINYWHFAARLEAQGYAQLINGQQLLQQLSITERVPNLGYVFRQSWGQQNRQVLHDFFIRTQQAKDVLCSSQQAWNNIADLTKTDDPIVQKTLRLRYCDGRIQQWGNEQIAAAEVMYQYLRQLSGNELTGAGEHIQAGTFWQ